MPTIKLRHLTQKELTCVSTCVAMLFNLDHDEVINELHDKWHTPDGIKALKHYLIRKATLPYELLSYWDDRTLREGAGMATVPSLNYQAGGHCVVVAFHQESDGTFKGQCFDPNCGKEGAKYYTMCPDLAASDEDAVLMEWWLVDLFVPGKVELID